MARFDTRVGPIIMTYEFHKNTLTVPASYLYEEEIMTQSNYKLMCHRGIINKVREGKGLGNYALVDFESIPERFRVKIVEKLGYPPKKQTQSLLMKYYRTDYEAIDFFATYKIDEYRTLPVENQEQYTADAEMLQALDIYLKEMAAFRKSRGGSLTNIWDEAAKAVAELKAEKKHKLPGTARRLKDKLADFKKDSYKSLISEKFQWTNASKVKDSQQEAFLRTLLRDHRNLDNEQIARIYENTAKIAGWKCLSASTIANYRTKWNLLTYGGNHGEKSFDNYVGMHVKRTAPTAPLLYWTLDGWDAELLYQDEKSHYNRLTIVVVLDPFSKYPVGYSIGTVESADLIKQALRNAVSHTQELFGAKYKVLQIQSDNYARKAMTPIYEFIADHYTPAKVGNAKSKVIEPYFKHLNKTYCQMHTNWSGFGVKAVKGANPEMLNKNRHNLPNKEQCIMQLQIMIERERDLKRAEYVKGFETMPEDAKKLLPEDQFLLNFGENTGYTNKRSHNGINPTILGLRMHYDSFNPDFRKYDHLEWQIKFNPEDLTQVLAHNAENGLSFILDQKHEQPMALYDRKEGDGEKLAQIQNYNKGLKENILEVQAEDFSKVRQLYFDQPELNDTLGKLLLTDSIGQHKDRKNAIRISAEKVAKKQEKKIIQIEAKSWNDEQDELLNNKVDFNKYLNND